MRHHIILAAVWLTVAASLAGAALPPDCDLLALRVFYQDRDQLAAVTSWTEPWQVDRRNGALLVVVDGDGFGRLVDLGLGLEIDDKVTAALCAPRTPLEGQRSGIPGYPCYRTVEETYATAENLVADHPGLAEWLDVGDSWEKATPGGLAGYDMRVLHLTNRAFAGTPTGSEPPHGKPRLLITGSIHAREYTPAELATRFGEWLVDGYGSDADATWLLDEHDIYLVLQTNPDGRKHAESGDYWRKNTNQSYCGATSSSRGADLNRNFDYQWGCCGGSSGSTCSDTYRGPSPASEPETQAVEDLMQAIFPDQKGAGIADPVAADATGLYIDLHSAAGQVLWPWGFTYTAAPNGDALQSLGRRFAWFNGYDPFQAVNLYPTDGTTDDFAYGDLGVAGYTFELGTDFFQDCSTFEGTILPDNLAALIYAAKVARTPYLTPGGPLTDAVTLASGSVVAPGDVVSLRAVVDDTRFSTLGGTEPTQAITAAELYVDTPPWRDPAPSPVAMSAADGGFDSTAEEVTADLDTTGLATGRHLLFVRGRDASGAWGAVSAAFLWLLDPAASPHIAGTVTDATSGLPVAATITVSPFSTTADPLSGAYDLMVPEGTYDIAVSADGYAPATLVDVPATGTTTTVRDVALSPYVDLLSDDVEGGNLGWTAQSPWGIVTTSSHSPSHSWTDSPAGNYSDDADVSLTSAVLDLSAASGVVLELWHRYDLESGYDYGHVEVSDDGGATWSEVVTVNGFSGGQWERLEIALPQLDGVAAARLRFRLSTDVSQTYDGWYVDDIRLRGALPGGPAVIFDDDFEGGDTGAWSAVTGD